VMNDDGYRYYLDSRIIRGVSLLLLLLLCLLLSLIVSPITVI